MTKRLVLIAALLTLAAAPAWAVPINPINTRPQPIGISGETTLQSILDGAFGCPGCVDAVTGQQSTAMWMLPGVPPQQIAPLLRIEVAGNAPSNVFGIWSGTDTGSLAFAPIFSGAATAATGALLKWFPNSSTLTISGDPGVVPGTYAINQYGFGFYLQGPDTTSGFGGKFWSADSLNPTAVAGTYPGSVAYPAYPNGTPQMLAYRETNSNRWALAFEDLPIGNGADGDHNDMVVTIESIVPVPEPGSMLLLGSGLIGLAGAVRRRMKK